MLCILGFLLCAIGSRAASTPDFSEAAAILQRGIEDHAFPGCTVVVGTADKILWSAAFGCLDYEHHVPVTKQTLYDLASVTKVTGTTAVFMQLVKQGKVRMSDPVSKYLPEFIELAPTAEDRAKRQQITVAHLLTHTAGLTAWKAYYRSHTNYAAMLQAILKTPLESDPGARFRYSDFGMLLAGEVASRAGKKPLAELERELVFVPLGMTNTLRNPPPRLRPASRPRRGGPTAPTSCMASSTTRTPAPARASPAMPASSRPPRTSPSWPPNSCAPPKERAPGSPNPCSRSSPARTSWPGMATAGWAGASNGASKRAIGHNGFTGTYIRVELSRKMYLVLLTNAVHPTRDNNKLGAVRRAFLDSVLQAFDQSAGAN